jgi:long-chain acyl-CoA synthetase
MFSSTRGSSQHMLDHDTSGGRPQMSTDYVDSEQTLQSLVRALHQRGERTALMVLRGHGPESWTYAQLAQLTRQLATGLSAQGLKRGDFAVLFAPNSVPWIIACLALLDIGAIPVPVDTQAPREDLVHILQDSEADWIFLTSELKQRLEQLQALESEKLVLLDEAPRDAPAHWRRFLAERHGESPTTTPQDSALLFYTSGTTGLPKGVELTHRNLVSNIAAVLTLNIARASDRLLLPLPLHHVYAFTVGLLAPLTLGATVVMPYSLTGPNIERALRDGRATAILGVPALYSALYDTIARRIGTRGRAISASFRAMLALSTQLRRTLGVNIGKWLFAPLRRRFAPEVRIVISGGAALEPALAWKLEGLGWQVATGYGLTETSPILAFVAPGARRLDHAGRPLPGVALRIAPSEPRSALGEVLAKGANVFSGYRHLPEKNARAFTADGWFRTGDLGYIDKQGCLHLGGRVSSMIVSPAGQNIDPEDIETALQRGRYIREAGVLQDDGRLSAIVVPDSRATRELDARALEQTMRDEVLRQSRELPSYEHVTNILIDKVPLPRTRLGKLRRHKLTQRYDQLQRQASKGRAPMGQVSIETLAPEDRELVEDPIASRAWSWLVRRFPNQNLAPDTNLRLDLAVDSMEWLSLTVELRDHAGVELSDEVIGRIETVRDLLREASAAAYATHAGVAPEAQLREPEALLDEAEQQWLKPSGAFARGLKQLLHLLVRPLVRHLFHLKVEGEAHIPQTGPYILTPNHESLLDPVLVGVALGRQHLRQTYWGGWTGIMFNSPLKRMFSRAMHVLPVDQSKGPLSSLALAAAALQKGYSLVWFPEGGRSTTGELLPFRPGVGLLARAHAIPLVPVWIEGSGKALPVGACRPRRVDLSVTFGVPLDPKRLEQQGSGEQPHERIASALREELIGLRRAVRNER